MRGSVPLRMECAPAFNYARDAHRTSIVPDASIPHGTTPTDTPNSSNHRHYKGLFESDSLSLDLRFIAETTIHGHGTHEDVPEVPRIELKELDLGKQGHLGKALCADFELGEGQCVTFVVRHDPPRGDSEKSRKPSEKFASEIGVSFDSELFFCLLRWRVLVVVGRGRGLGWWSAFSLERVLLWTVLGFLLCPVIVALSDRFYCLVSFFPAIIECSADSWSLEIEGD